MALKVSKSKASTPARGTKHKKGSLNGQHSSATKIAKKQRNLSDSKSQAMSDMEF